MENTVCYDPQFETESRGGVGVIRFVVAVVLVVLQLGSRVHADAGDLALASVSAVAVDVAAGPRSGASAFPPRHSSGHGGAERVGCRAAAAEGEKSLSTGVGALVLRGVR